jgi:Uma2 family endonuclease
MDSVFFPEPRLIDTTGVFSMSQHPLHQARGPFFATQLRDGDPYELSNGHPIECLPAGGRHARANLVGGLAVETDPEVEDAAVDAGYAFGPQDLRAPDIAVGNVPDAPGWIAGVPPLAVEYADSGQDEQELQDKIRELLAAGTRYLWVVRLQGPRRVEVYEPGQRCWTLYPGQELRAPGVLKNPLPVEALYDPQAAHEVALRNLLQRKGYDSLDAVRDQGRAEGKAEGKVEGKAEGKAEGELGLVLRLLDKRLGGLSPELAAPIRQLDSAQLNALGEALLDFDQERDVQAWLNQFA